MGLTVRIKGYEGAYDCGYITYGNFIMRLIKEAYGDVCYEIFQRSLFSGRPFTELDEIEWAKHQNDDLELMKKYILRMEEEPCNYEDRLKYYKCADVSYWQLSESLLAKLPELEPSLKAAHKRGVCDMWDAVKYLWDRSNLDYHWSAEEVLTEYLESIKKRPEPYEEWMYVDGTKCVVMDKTNDMLSVFTENGCIETCTTDDLKKFTGRIFTQIEEVLKAMQ